MLVLEILADLLERTDLPGLQGRAKSFQGGEMPVLEILAELFERTELPGLQRRPKSFHGGEMPLLEILADFRERRVLTLGRLLRLPLPKHPHGFGKLPLDDCLELLPAEIVHGGTQLLLDALAHLRLEFREEIGDVRHKLALDPLENDGNRFRPLFWSVN